MTSYNKHMYGKSTYMYTALLWQLVMKVTFFTNEQYVSLMYIDINYAIIITCLDLNIFQQDVLIFAQKSAWKYVVHS